MVVLQVKFKFHLFGWSLSHQYRGLMQCMMTHVHKSSWSYSEPGTWVRMFHHFSLKLELSTKPEIKLWIIPDSQLPAHNFPIFFPGKKKKLTPIQTLLTLFDIFFLLKYAKFLSVLNVCLSSRKLRRYCQLSNHWAKIHLLGTPYSTLYSASPNWLRDLYQRQQWSLCHSLPRRKNRAACGSIFCLIITVHSIIQLLIT